MNSYLNLVKSPSPEIENILENPFMNIPEIEEAISLSKKYKIALHPRYTLYWNELTANQLVLFLDHLKKLNVEENALKSTLPVIDKIKRYCEISGIEHSVKSLPLDEVKSEDEVNVLEFDELNTKIILSNLGVYDFKKFDLKNQLDSLLETTKKNLEKKSSDILTLSNEIEIRDKGGTYIGARMGRPEKAKIRKLTGRPHGLFPVGEEGGRLRNLMEAYSKKGKVSSQFIIYYCSECDRETIYPKCEECSNKTEERYFEKWTDKQVNSDNKKAVRYKKIELEVQRYVDKAREIVNSVQLPKLVKGIKGTSNRNHVTEHIVKVFLRAKNDVYVNKDGTVRFDMIEMGITHFKPKEIGTSIEKLKELGYEKDYLGNPLKDENQLVEILPQDVILPDCVESGDELASEFIINTANFIDDLLESLYKLPRFYNFKTREDTIGHLVIGLAPHTSAGIIGRIIGYSKTQGCFSHPVWHAAQRRNLDGDENGIMLLMDGLINFSVEYLPDRLGARTMDTSLVLTSHLHLDQIDDEVHGMDIVGFYPLELYQGAKEYRNPRDFDVERIEKRISEEVTDDKYLGYSFTHSTDDLNNTVLCSSYKLVPLMVDKMNMQLEMGTKIRAVDENKVRFFDY